MVGKVSSQSVERAGTSKVRVPPLTMEGSVEVGFKKEGESAEEKVKGD